MPWSVLQEKNEGFFSGNRIQVVRPKITPEAAVALGKHGTLFLKFKKGTCPHPY
jgi:hypothetical protein